MQYLISIYFDEKTDKIFRTYMEAVANCCGNTFMLDHHVPPHITVSAFETEDEAEVVAGLEECIAGLQKGILQWVSIGVLPNGVLYLAPVLNQYLQKMSEEIHASVKSLKDVKISKYYQPFHWLPHATIAKKMTPQEMQEGFAVLQTAFACREGKVVKIGLATKNPYREIYEWWLG